MFNQDMLNKLQVLQKQAEESKSRLDAIKIVEDAGGGLIRISLNGNRKLESLEINADLSVITKEDLEDLISVALTRALDRANALNEQEMMSSAQSLFPGM